LKGSLKQFAECGLQDAELAVYVIRSTYINLYRF